MLTAFQWNSIPHLFPENFDDSAWRAWRSDVRARTLFLLGPFPQERPPLEAEVLDETPMDGYLRRKVRFRSESKDRIPAYLLIPDDTGAPRPAMVAVHSSGASGKSCTVGLTGLSPDDPPDRGRAYALDAVHAGFVVLAPDLDAIGERAVEGRVWDTRPFYDRCPHWSVMGKAAWDLSRAREYLAAQSFVDAERIAVMGHCFGAYNSVLAAAFDERFAAVAVSSGLWTFRSGKNAWARDPDDPERIANAKRIHGEKAGVYTHIARLAEYIGTAGTIF
jgi:dienelactone hydrolase